MTSQFAPTTLRTLSRRTVDIQKPTPLAFSHLESVAQALSQINRFSGQTIAPYSVAQHSVLCAVLAPEGLQRHALLHDVHEAIIGDQTRPLKFACPGLDRFEAMWTIAAAEAYGLTWSRPMSEAIRIVDRLACATELVALQEAEEEEARDLIGVAPLPLAIQPWEAEMAKWRFATAFEILSADKTDRIRKFPPLMWWDMNAGRFGEDITLCRTLVRNLILRHVPELRHGSTENHTPGYDHSGAESRSTNSDHVPPV